MSRLYVTVETGYFGEPQSYQFEITPDEIADKCEEACETAFTYYGTLPENADVPAEELYKSVSVREINYIRLS